MKSIEEKAKEYLESKVWLDGEAEGWVERTFTAGYQLCQKEWEEKTRWIPVEERFPEFDKSKYPNGDFKRYEVKYNTGGMSHKCVVQVSHLVKEGRFNLDSDCTRATHWREIIE